MFEDSEGDETQACINLVRTLEIFECVLLSSKIQTMVSKYYPAICNSLKNVH